MYIAEAKIISRWEPGACFLALIISWRSTRTCMLSRFSLVWLFWDPMDCSPRGSSVHGVSQARILEWVAVSFSRGSSWPRDWTCVEPTSTCSRAKWRTWVKWVVGIVFPCLQAMSCIKWEHHHTNLFIPDHSHEVVFYLSLLAILFLTLQQRYYHMGPYLPHPETWFTRVENLQLKQLLSRASRR